MIKEKIDECPLCTATNQEKLFDDFDGNCYVKCNECGLTFQNPRSVTEYEEDYWGESVDPDGNKRILVNERDQSIRNKHAFDINYVNALSPGKILDAGAGFGFFLSALDDKWDKYAIELSDFCVDYIAQTYPDIKVASANIEDASYEAESFDVIYSHHVIEHVEKPHDVMRNMAKMLKPGGLLIIGCPNIDSFAAKRFRGNYRLLGSPHILMWNETTLTDLLSRYGFGVFKRNFPYFGSDYVNLKNIIRLLDKSKVSPPFYGNLMTLYARKQS